MKIFSVPDMGKFLDLVEMSQGDVTLHLPEGGQLNLKQGRAAQELVRTMSPGQSGLHITLSNRADTPAYIRYMMEAGASR